MGRNERVMDEWGVFSHNVKESPLDKINNVSHRQSIIGQILNFGDVEIQTAAEQGATVLKFVSSPQKLHEAIVSAQQDFIKGFKEFAEGDTKKCPFCAEIIKAEAIICRYCRRELRISEKEPEAQAEENLRICHDPKEYWRSW